MTIDLFQFKGKRALIIGGATGMGAAVAKLSASLGAETVVLDVADITYAVTESCHIDLRDKASVEQCVNELGGQFDVIHACAGVADGTPCLMLINFISQRHIIESLMAAGRVNIGGAVVFISSISGLPFHLNRAAVTEFLAATDWDEAAAWIETHEGTNDYSFSKQAINGYIEGQAMNFIQRGVRINGVMPGPTDTPLARANADIWLAFAKDYREQIGLGPLAPEQVAQTMAFLASNAASGVNGANLIVDFGHTSASASGCIDEPAVRQMLGV